MRSFNLACALLLAAWARAAGAEIKFATLAPEGTDAMKLMREVDSEVRARTGGGVGFKFYPGGRQGDEKDMVRKIRLGQLHAGGFTGVGLGEIAPEVRVLDAPWLFRDSREVDLVTGAFSKEFEAAFSENGFVLLGWTEVGFVHVFSKAPVRSAKDLRSLKLWAWEGDPIAEAAFKAVGVHPIPLSISDVNTSLQTGLINAVYASALYAIALQWHEKTRFILGPPIAHASGAVLISKKAFDALSPDQQAALRDASRGRLRKLNDLTRRENASAIETLKKMGLCVTELSSKAEAEAFSEAGRRARRELCGRLFPEQFLTRVEKSLSEFRAGKGPVP
jgi:TRAP-type C4-dicarboxylate transport system substrate-binding protein